MSNYVATSNPSRLSAKSIIVTTAAIFFAGAVLIVLLNGNCGDDDNKLQGETLSTALWGKQASAALHRVASWISIPQPTSFLPGWLVTYDSLSAKQKQSYLWEQMIPGGTHGNWANPLETVVKASMTSYTILMETITTDWREEGHQKITHGQGATALAHFEWLPNKYTGMFQKADHCVIRMANAAHPSQSGVKATYGPNLAIKCLNDGKKSANLLNLWQLDGYDSLPKDRTDSCSFFEAGVCSHIPLRDNMNAGLKKIFVPAFNKVDSNSMLVGVSQFAKVDQTGQNITSPEFPFSLHFQPRPEYNKIPCEFDAPGRNSQLLSIPSDLVNKALYDVYAIHDPWMDRPAGKPDVRKIGELILDTAFIGSKYGDQRLFFEHTFWAKEVALLDNDPDRQKNWNEYTGNTEFMKTEGAMLYEQYLPKM